MHIYIYIYMYTHNDNNNDNGSSNNTATTRALAARTWSKTVRACRRTGRTLFAYIITRGIIRECRIIYMCACVYTCVYIYIYRERERSI